MIKHAIIGILFTIGISTAAHADILGQAYFIPADDNATITWREDALKLADSFTIYREGTTSDPVFKYLNIQKEYDGTYTIRLWIKNVEGEFPNQTSNETTGRKSFDNLEDAWMYALKLKKEYKLGEE